MPIYEYFCPHCNNVIELRLSFNDTNCTTLCPKCYSSVDRLISSFACKTGGNTQAAEKPFRENMAQELLVSSVLITPPPNQAKQLSPPAKEAIRARHKKK
jgi:putative FmdB family regulatory protein